jgi:hypothetical protein
MLGKNYHRLAPAFPPGQVIPMDAANRVPDLVAFAQTADISSAAQWIAAEWE